MNTKHPLLLTLGLCLGLHQTCLGAANQVPYRVAAKLPDVVEPAPLDQVRLGGWLGHRVDINAQNRLLTVDTAPLLAGFQKKPGTHPWIGEHAGKWLHAATLAWANNGDPTLRAKLDQVARALIAAQEPDGYLGTYVPEKRFGLYAGADWDVWSHKYNLLGLLTYHQYTGHPAALTASQKIGDLLARTFPAKRSILAAGTHVGMAATSVLEPMVLLYRLTGEERHLEFCHYLVKSWDEPQGPQIIATLRREKSVRKTANAKAYEMMSNLVGLCELARATGRRELLEPVFNAWRDVVDNGLYVTGSASSREHFQADHVLPNDVASHIGETCVTTTWIQLNWQLLRLTGEARFGDELDRSFYNHLAAAQHLNGADWCYYTALEGRKQYDKGITCCHSSGPRGFALAPGCLYWKSTQAGAEIIVISTLETSQATLRLGTGEVRVEQASQFPASARSEVTLRVKGTGPFGIRLRTPYWGRGWQAQAGGQTATVRDGWAEFAPRQWQDGEVIKVTGELQQGILAGTHGNTNLSAAVWGPFVLACDQTDNPGLPSPARLTLASNTAPVLRSTQPLTWKVDVLSRADQRQAAVLVPFADAGASNGTYRVWLRAPGVAFLPTSLLSDGEESRSRAGNLNGSILDDNADSSVVTFNGQPAREDWYAVRMNQATTLQRVVFIQGQIFHDGGWFDHSAGTPRIQVQRTQGGAWETVGELGDYPRTTANQSMKLRAGQAFTLQLPTPITVWGVRVTGVPASGDNPKQAFSSCAELQAFAR
jgi:DUF1680 family protein